MGINFTISQKIDTLKKLGYTVETVITFKSYNEYQDRDVIFDCPVIVAYKGELNLERRDDYSVTSEYGFEVVFERELQERLLSILF